MIHPVMLHITGVHDWPYFSLKKNKPKGRLDEISHSHH